jgi:hypothetical protein
LTGVENLSSLTKLSVRAPTAPAFWRGGVEGHPSSPKAEQRGQWVAALKWKDPASKPGSRFAAQLIVINCSQDQMTRVLNAGYHYSKQSAKAEKIVV